MCIFYVITSLRRRYQLWVNNAVEAASLNALIIQAEQRGICPPIPVFNVLSCGDDGIAMLTAVIFFPFTLILWLYTAFFFVFWCFFLAPCWPCVMVYLKCKKDSIVFESAGFYQFEAERASLYPCKWDELFSEHLYEQWSEQHPPPPEALAQLLNKHADEQNNGNYQDDKADVRLSSNV